MRGRRACGEVHAIRPKIGRDDVAALQSPSCATLSNKAQEMTATESPRPMLAI
jgi:hypothetical protein